MTRMIFFDIEFSDLQPAALMISAGFVAEDDDALYLEVEETWWLPKASKFVRDKVKPLLRGEGLSANEAALQIIHWLNSKGPEITLISDSDWDLRILQNHLELAAYHWPHRWRWDKAPQHLPSKAHHAYHCAYLEWFLRSGHEQHNALNDAQAIRHAHITAMTANE